MSCKVSTLGAGIRTQVTLVWLLARVRAHVSKHVEDPLRDVAADQALPMLSEVDIEAGRPGPMCVHVSIDVFSDLCGEVTQKTHVSGAKLGVEAW